MNATALLPWFGIGALLAVTYAAPIAARLAAKYVREHASRDQRRLILEATSIVYDAISQAARKTPNRVDDKLAEGLALFRKMVGCDLTEDVEAFARTALQAEHERRRS